MIELYYFKRKLILYGHLLYRYQIICRKFFLLAVNQTYIIHLKC